MLVHCKVTPSIKFAGTHLYTWVERGTVRVKCPAQEHNTMSPARAQTWTARSGDKRTNHEATAPPTSYNSYNTNTWHIWFEKGFSTSTYTISWTRANFVFMFFLLQRILVFIEFSFNISFFDIWKHTGLMTLFIININTYTVKPRSTDTRLIRTPASNGQFSLSRQLKSSYIFS